MDKDFIRNVVEYVANDHTIADATEHFNKSESSIKKYLAKFRDPNGEYYEPILAEKLKLSQQKKILEGTKLGGSMGKRGKNYEEFTARMYAEAYMSGKTLEQLSELSKIPKSTLHEMIRGIEDEDLQRQIDEYISRAGVETWKR